MNVQQLENELWEAADQLRANSKLTAAEYSMPVLGLIFLRHADNRFKAYLPGIEADIPPQVAVFDLLQKDSLTKGDRDAIKKVAKELLDKLTSGKLQIDHWREKATAQAQVKAEIIKHLFAHLPSGAYDAD